MQTRALLLSVAFGCTAQLVVACGGQASESHSSNAGSGNSAGSGAVSGAGASAGTSAGGATGTAGSVAVAGAGGAVARAPAKHRASAASCDHTRATVEPNVPPDVDGSIAMCRSDADCNSSENGRCVGNGHAGWRCTYDKCFSDLDCATIDDSPALCECEGEGVVSEGNTCLKVECRLDSDCGSGNYCSPSFGSCGRYSGIEGYFCHSKADECVDDADCNPDGSANGVGYCAFMPTVGHWQCSTAQCVG